MITATPGKKRRTKAEVEREAARQQQARPGHTRIQGLELPNDHELVRALKGTEEGGLGTRDQGPATSQEPINFNAVSVGLAKLDRHPDNRVPTAEDVEAKAASMAADGQLEPLVIRVVPGERYQILSGETRWLAAQKLGWETIKARVIACDDARALELLADYNGHRKDLNPIQQARLIVRLCEPKDKGGSGLTREAAGRKVGVESGSAASNLVRLLELPQAWQDRVASGELPQSYAREILPIRQVPMALEALEDDWKIRDERWEETFKSRDNLADQVETYLQEFTRQLDKQDWQHKVCIHPDDIEANRKKLEVVTLTIDGKDVEAATNVKLFDELMKSAVAKHLEKKGKHRAAKAGADADAGEQEESRNREKTKEEIAFAKQQRAEQLGRSIDAWYERLLRREIAEAVSQADVKKPNAKLLKLVFHFFVSGAADSARIGDSLSDRLEEFTKIVGIDAHTVLTASCERAQNPIQHLQWLAIKLCPTLIADEEQRGAHFFDETLQALFDEWGCDLSRAWGKLHATKHPMLEEFFQMHRKAELLALGKELGVPLVETQGKPDMLEMLLNRPQPLPLPKCLQPEKPKRGARNSERGTKKKGS